MAIPQTFVQELLTRVDIVDIVGRYVQLKKGGANFMGLCPFHGEKSPSFSVSPTKQFYHCFGCGKHGDAINFLMEHTGASFVESVNDLAQQYGLQVPEDDASPADRARAAEQRQKQATLSDVLEKAGEAYRKHLKHSPRAVAYFKGRGLSGEIAKRFGLGYAPEGWRALASVFPDYSDPLLVESGLVISNTEESEGDGASKTEEKRYDRFRDRVMFPIRSIKGECIGFGGRVLGDDKPKYLNSPETPVFSKGRELYGLFEARMALRDAGYVLVTEGYMDVVALAQLGFPNAVATLGTACTTEHVQKLFRFTESVVFSFDGDAAGRRAARKALDGALPYATDTRSVKFLFLPAEHDPDSFIREHGADAFARYVSEATPLSRFLIESSRDGCDLTTAEGRAHMTANARPLWSLLPEGALKRQLLGEIAALAQLGAAELEALWAQASQGRRGGAPNQGSGASRRDSGSYSAPEDGYYDEPADFDGEPSTSGWSAPSGKRSGFKSGFKSGNRQSWADRQNPGARRRTPRVLPPGRADRALQIVFTDAHAWSSLSNDDHHLLCELSAPHGPLFSWLDAQEHEHGAQAWDQLKTALEGHEHAAYALAAIARLPVDIENDREELRQILRIERKRLLDEERQELSLRAASDPAAFERLKQLIAAEKT